MLIPKIKLIFHEMNLFIFKELFDFYMNDAKCASDTPKKLFSKEGSGHRETPLFLLETPHPFPIY